MLLHEILMSAN